jgi:Mor family transcriptional regulator
MSYKRAEEILPIEIIEMIQFYIDGENIYIPRKENNKVKWGDGTQIRRELQERNTQIFAEYNEGLNVVALANKYFLSEKSIQRIIREMKKTA